MVYDKVNNLFRSLPPAAKRSLRVVPLKYRLGGSDFSETFDFLEESEYWERDRLEYYQQKKLEELLDHAVETVPYYRNVDLKHDDPYRNLKEFPIVDKETIRKNPEMFISNVVNEVNTYHVTTGGTSGEPFEFRLDNSTYGEEWAFIMTGWRRMGYEPDDQMISFKAVSYERADEGIFWKYNPLYNTYEFSPFHLTPENITEYVKKINKIDPKYIHGYPSAITTLANHVNNTNAQFPPIDGVFAASENVYNRQREIIENAFNTRVFSHYGQSEKVALAAECEYTSSYHAYPQYGYTELLNDAEKEVDVGETGEIVATGFLNTYLPFIRYRTGDYAVKGPIGDCKCGRAYRVLPEIQGREEKERMVYVDSNHTVAIHLLYYSMHGNALQNINSVQFYQEIPGELLVRIVPQTSSKDVNQQKITDSIKQKVGSKMSVKIEFVNNIELTESGKKKLLIQNIE